MDKKIELHCEPELSVVWRLLGMAGGADAELQEILEMELAALRPRVHPTALVRRVRIDKALFDRMYFICGDKAGSVQSWLAPGEELLAVLLTVGTADDYAAELFAAGEHLRGLMADALLGAWLFAMDGELLSEVGVWCAAHGFGVLARLEAPADIPIGMQRVICAWLESEARAGVHVNDAGMLVPEKSMCYLLRLDRECGRFAAGHDCARCGSKKCGMKTGKRCV